MNAYGISEAKIVFLFCTGAVGAFMTEIFGGWSSDITTLVIFMAIDYILGLIIAAIYKKSDKSKNGALSSKAAFVGIVKKVLIIGMVLVAHRLDLLMKTDYIKSGAVIAFCVSELIRIAENLGIIGVPMPKVISRAIDILKDKSDEDDEKEGKDDDQSD